ncbi:MAG: helix-turn-helix domain-containing protein [Patescibacteria group bacterium]|nr:helix-turn-helix domain-containing protein [Patescibacteria group bacterium]
MINKEDSLVQLLKPFGLSVDESRVYIQLLKTGPQTALKLSRSSKIGRTKMYRILEDLEEKNLVSALTRSYGREFEASSTDNLKLIVARKAKEATEVRSALPQVMTAFSLLSDQDVSRSKVLHYNGTKGLKRVIWNQRRAVGSVRTFVSEKMSKYLDFGLGDEVRLEFVKRHVKIFELRNEKHIPKWTNVVEIVRSLWEVRYIPASQIEMDFEFVLYNDVIAMYGLDGLNVFCVEIYNERSARMMSRMFDFMMKHAKPMKILNEHGEARVG